MLSPREVVKEVAKLIAEENLCYVHRSSREITSFPIDDIKAPEIAEQIALIESKIIKYMKVTPMDTPALVSAMEYFIPEVTDKGVAKELERGLKRKNPVRNFMQIVNSHMDLKQHWRRFMKEHTHWYVEQIIIVAYNH